MNYRRIYKNLIKKAISENRSKVNGQSFEAHHIIPRFMYVPRKYGRLTSNPDKETNIVLLTPREHMLAHLLLVRILKGKPQEIAAGNSLSWFFTIAETNPRLLVNLITGITKRYEVFRKKSREYVSKMNKGKFPAKCRLTGASIGRVSSNHPNVLSGLWVHHSAGVKLNEERKIKIRENSKGDKNGNAKPLTAEIEEIAIEVCRSLTDFNLQDFLDCFNKKELYKNPVSVAWVYKNFGSFDNLLLKSGICKYTPKKYKELSIKKKPKCDVNRQLTPKLPKKVFVVIEKYFPDAIIEMTDKWMKIEPNVRRGLGKKIMLEFLGPTVFREVEKNGFFKRGVTNEFLQRKFGNNWLLEKKKFKESKKIEATLEYKIQKHGHDIAEKMMADMVARNTTNGYKSKGKPKNVKNHKN
jgi:hypothetical protein